MKRNNFDKAKATIKGLAGTAITIVLLAAIVNIVGTISLYKETVSKYDIPDSLWLVPAANAILISVLIGSGIVFFNSVLSHFQLIEAMKYPELEVKNSEQEKTE